MLYPTLSQPIIILLFVVIGFFSGFIFDIFSLINYFFNNNKISRQIFYFLSIFPVFIIFYYLNLSFNYGQIRFYPFLLFFSSLILERITLGNIFAKLYDKCYNLNRKLWEKLSKWIYGRRKREEKN